MKLGTRISLSPNPEFYYSDQSFFCDDNTNTELISFAGDYECFHYITFKMLKNTTKKNQ